MAPSTQSACQPVQTIAEDATRLLDFFDDLGAFDELETNTMHTSGYGWESDSGRVDTATKYHATEGFAALLNSDSLLREELDTGSPRAAPTRANSNRNPPHPAIRTAACVATANSTAPDEQPKRKKKKISSSLRQKAELSYLRAKVAELGAELADLASVARTARAGSTIGAANTKPRASMWEVLANSQLEEKVRAEKENATLRQKVEGELKFVKSLERMLRKRRVRGCSGGVPLQPHSLTDSRGLYRCGTRCLTLVGSTSASRRCL